MINIFQFIQPLNLERIFIDFLAGNSIVFLFLAFIIIAIMAAIFKMPGGAFMTVFIAFILLMAGTFLGGSGILQGLLLIILTGLAYMIAKNFSKGID